MAFPPVTSSDESLAAILVQVTALAAQSKAQGTASTDVVNKLGIIAIQLETQNMLALVAAARNPTLVGTPYLPELAKRLNMDPVKLGLVAQ